MICDMCGSNVQLYKTKIEDTILNVCDKCGKYGTIISKVVPENKNIKHTTQTLTKPQITQLIAEDYSKKIKQAREANQLTQKELAHKIAEKESVIHQLESGHLEPSIKLARKLESHLKIKIVESFEEKKIVFEHEETEGLTLGDFIKRNK